MPELCVGGVGAGKLDLKASRLFFYFSTWSHSIQLLHFIKMGFLFILEPIQGLLKMYLLREMLYMAEPQRIEDCLIGRLNYPGIFLKTIVLEHV